MNRKQLKELTRILADELTEAPEGLFTDVELDTLINVSQRNVQVELLVYIPWYFRKTRTASFAAAKREYSIIGDLSIIDLFMIEKIVPMAASLGNRPLVYLEPKDIWRHGGKGLTGFPRAWGYESKGSIFFEPTPTEILADAVKIYYIERIPDLNNDEIDCLDSLPTVHRARAENVATIGVLSSKGLEKGDEIVVSGLGGAYNGPQIVVSVPTSTHFTYANTGVDEEQIADTGGTITLPTTKISTSRLPEETHQLIALDALRQWFIRDQSALTDINERFNKLLQSVVFQLSSPGNVKNAELTSAVAAAGKAK